MTDLLDGVTVSVAAACDIQALADLRVAWSGEDAVEPGFVDCLTGWFEQERDHRTTWLARAGERPLAWSR